MPRRIETFTLDLDRHDMSTKFKAKDFEDMELHITLTKNNSIFKLDGCSVDFVSSNGIEEVLDVVDNIIKVKFNNGYDANKIYEGELVITDSEGTLKTPSFFFYICRSLSGEINVVFISLIDNEGYILLDSENNFLKVRG